MKEDKNLKLSIITPSYNQGDFIEKTILSVIQQPYSNVEYIIIDGGSTDHTVEVIKKYADKIHYWCSEKDRGQSHALNKGLARATGDVLAWINSDDYYEDSVFPLVMKLFEDPNVSIVHGDCMVHHTNGSPSWLVETGQVDHARLLRYWQPFFCPPQPSIFFRKSVLESVGPINESLHYAMDLDLWLKMSQRYPFTYLKELLSHYLIHDSSKSGSEGGFSKFVPEWKSLSHSYLEQASYLDRLTYWKDHIMHRLGHYGSYAREIIKNKLQ